MVVVLLLEMGTAGVLEGASPELSAISQSLPEGKLAEAFAELDDEQREKLTALSNQDKPPGLAIPDLALLGCYCLR